jgi:hypothetical protein
MDTCSVKNRLGSWDYYRSAQKPSVRRVAGQVALDDALPPLPADALLVGQGRVVRGRVCRGDTGLGRLPGEGVLIGTWVALGIIGVVLWKMYG